MEDLSDALEERAVCNLFQVKWHKDIRFEAAAINVMPPTCTENEGTDRGRAKSERGKIPS